ncbi:MAG: hypothetical protein AAF074_18320 [Pseudomonadota bacterium]
MDLDNLSGFGRPQPLSGDTGEVDLDVRRPEVAPGTERDPLSALFALDTLGDLVVDLDVAGAPLRSASTGRVFPAAIGIDLSNGPSIDVTDGPAIETLFGVEALLNISEKNALPGAFPGFPNGDGSLPGGFTGFDGLDGIFGVGEPEPDDPGVPADFDGALFPFGTGVAIFPEDAGPPGAMSIGDTVTDTIETFDDADLFNIAFTAGQTVIIEAFATEQNIFAPFDPLLSVLDPGGTVVAFNDDSNVFITFDALLNFTPQETGTFQLAVGGFGSSVGDYGLSAVLFSDQFIEAQQVVLLFDAAFDTIGQAEGVNAFIDQLQAGASLVDVANQMIASDEFVETVGDPAVIGNTAFVTAILGNTLDAPPPASTVDFFVDILNEPDVGPGELLVSAAFTPEHVETTPEIFSLPITPDGGVDPDLFALLV